MVLKSNILQVTFRLLSRQLSIHINDAKRQVVQSQLCCVLTIYLRELELFHEASKQSKTPVFATYVLTGVSAPQIHPASGSSSSQRLLEEIPTRLVTLVNEEDLEGKSRYQPSLNSN